MFFQSKSEIIGILPVLLYVLSVCDAKMYAQNPSIKIADVFKNEQISYIEILNKNQNKTIIKSIQDILKNIKCIIPNNADSITRAALLQQCISPSHGFGNETRCFHEEDLGCFPMEYPWTSNLRPFPQPMRPDEVDVILFLYTSENNSQYNVTLRPNISLQGSDFNPKRNYTVLIVPGFFSDTKDCWMSDLKDAYLKHRDANIFLVDWGKGSKRLNYLQVASNTRIVGAELVRFGKYLIVNYQLKPENIHLMGHSLGAHICSYFTKGIPGVKRITAFDPAQPGFEGCDNEVRLDKSDAEFIDVIHTSGRPLIPFLGYGFIGPVGHVDIYMNGGIIQPGCIVPPINDIYIKDISDLAVIPVEVLFNWVSCSHHKAILYFIESLEYDCVFWAQKTNVLTAITDIAAMGQLRPIMWMITKCKFEECVPLGLDSELYPGRGSFGAGTMFLPPFCIKNPNADKFMREEYRKSKLLTIN